MLQSTQTHAEFIPDALSVNNGFSLPDIAALSQISQHLKLGHISSSSLFNLCSSSASSSHSGRIRPPPTYYDTVPGRIICGNCTQMGLGEELEVEGWYCHYGGISHHTCGDGLMI